MKYKKIIVILFFWSGSDELNRMTFDSYTDYCEWKTYQRSSIEILSEKEEVESIS